jgi:hypothetical protein
MVSTETWMGSGQSVTLAPESELFLGYMNLGPTLGMANTNKAHLIKYSVGYALNGTSVTVGTTAKFSDYYELVPDLYTGCTANFYYSDSSTDAATLRFSARVAGNDADAIYFSGDIKDYPTLYNKDTNATAANPRGYIVLEAKGSIIPAPHSLETIDGSVTALVATNTTITNVLGNGQKFVVGDIIRRGNGTEIGRVITSSENGTLLNTITEPVSATTHLHLITNSLATVSGTPVLASVTISSITTSDLTGILTAGDWVSIFTSDVAASATLCGRVMYVSSTIVKVALIAAGDNPANTEHIFLGRTVFTAGVGATSIHRVSPRILSNNWLGLTNTVGIPTVDIETKQLNLSLAGSRNWSYQYRGMETAGQASLDVNLNHGSWLYYAFGGLSSATTAGTDTVETATNVFETATAASTTAHLTFAGYSTGDDDDRNSSTHLSNSNGKFHRVLKNTQTICPPILPFNSIAKIANPSDDGTTGIQDEITYVFSERNDSTLPTFALELLTQKGSLTLGDNKSLMVDRNTYNESVYAQIYPGCAVSDLTLSANENEEVKATLNMNVKRVFEAPDGYVGKCYDSTDNDTSEFKNLLNFGQQTGANANITQSFIDPFFFSNGSISLFGQEFLKVNSFSLSLQNTLTDKRYVGQYNNQIKDFVTGQRTYEITMQALVTDRRLFDELRNASPHRISLGETADGTNAKIALSFTKSNGESIRLEFDDYMVSASTWPLQDDRGPILVDFTIMPLRTATLNAVTHWVMQS